MIARANGVVPKLAQRITHELKDKAGALGGIAGSAPALAVTPGPLADAVTALTGLGFKPGEASAAVAAAGAELGADASLDALVRVARSEERRGGKECVRTCRSRCSPDH